MSIKNHEGQEIRESDQIISFSGSRAPKVIGYIVGFRNGAFGQEAVVRMQDEMPNDNIFIYSLTELCLYAEAGHGSTVSVNTKTKWFVA